MPHDQRATSLLHLPKCWTASCHLRLATFSACVRSTVRTIVDEFAHLHRHLLVAPTEPAHVTLSLFAQRRVTPQAGSQRRLRYVLLEEDDLLYTTSNRRELVPELEMALACCLVEHLSDYLQLHAGAVVKRGVGLLVVGPPGAGKTTLVCTLLAHGFSYLADEVVFLEVPSLRILPYYRALSIKAGSLDPLRPFLPRLSAGGYHIKEEKGPFWYVNPLDVVSQADRGAQGESGAAPARLGAGAPLRAILLPQLAAQPAAPSLEPMPRSLMLRHLANQLVRLPAPRVPSFEALLRLVERCACFTLRSGEAPATAALVAQLVDRLAATPETGS
ncbi:MAG: hypothetical protein HYY96_03780 [Candidatus Tectomicrobia bacterium]|nr:hypothetical protein [Candidatus Tectomicrobia bacterium]